MEPELLKKKIKAVRDRQRLKKLVVKIIFGIVLVLGIMMGLLSLYSLAVAANNNKLIKKIDAAKQKIESLREVESKQVYLLSKLDSFKGLIKVQERHQAVAETVFNLIPDGTTLKVFDVNEQGNIALSGSVSDWLTLNKLIDRIKNPQSTKLKVIKAEVNKISFSNKGEISFTINLSLSGSKIK